MIEKKLREAFDRAIILAKTYNHEYITLDHIFLGLLKDELISQIILNLDLNIDEIESKIKQYIIKNVPKFNKNDPNNEPLETVSVSQTIEQIIAKANMSGRNVATVEDMFVAILNNDKTYSTYLLKQYGLARVDFLEEISHGSSSEVKDKKKKKSILKENSIELVALAKEGKIDPVIGRSKEINRIIEILGRKKKNNPLLVGEPGVGKTAIVEGLALLIAKNEVPVSLKEAKIYSLDVSNIIAGTKYRGDFEKKLKNIIKEVLKEKNSIVFIDEIHQIIGAGSVGGNSMDASNILKPLLASGKIKCIGATTYEEYRTDFSKDKAFSRRFSKIDVVEPSIDESIKILQGLKVEYEKFHGVIYDDEAISECVNLSKKYINDKFLPDSAIDVLDEAAVSKKYISLSKKIRITKTDIQKTISKIANIPSKTLTRSDLSIMANLQNKLLKKIYAQDEAIKKIVNAIKINKAGLGIENKPIGSFLFTGSTGVGKTEVAKELANELGIKFIRFDMSEFMEAHSIAKLIGAPAGYVGYEKGGLLSEEIKKHPHSVLLFDEIEKAHPDIFNILLQILDYGTLTDNNGNKIDFKNVIIILTSNLGTKESPVLGFTNDKGSNIDKAIKDFFSPELRNRLDEIIRFNSLSKDVVIKIVEKFIKEMEQNLSEKKIKISISKKAKEKLAQLGYNKEMGARPLQKVIKEQIKSKLTDEILFGKLKNGGRVKIDYKDNSFSFVFPREKIKRKTVDSCN